MFGVHTLCWEYSSTVALAQCWSGAQCVPLIGLGGGRGALELHMKTLSWLKKNLDPSPQFDEANKPCTEAAHGAVSVSSKRKAEDLPTLMSVSRFAGWSPFQKIYGDQLKKICKGGQQIR
ncbi:hypothetical protein PoB_000781200 [Plakobranchus ocellatus]|uniref:Uncharacterized protein n=1 Tax=Plakobranchus ocellatus TaxID=259542 RepID=A0AAV3YGF7_9GAST|nr:hypothetical protein PoB_000781200 [Plakobranchus ocellatus]